MKYDPMFSTASVSTDSELNRQTAKAQRPARQGEIAGYKTSSLIPPRTACSCLPTPYHEIKRPVSLTHFFPLWTRAYIDDVIIFSRTAQEHVHVSTGLGLFEELNLGINPKKSFFGFPSVRLLVFKADGLGLSTTDDRMAAISKLKMPESLDALEQYIGMTGFLRKFIPWYQQKVQPLEDRKATTLKQEKADGTIPVGKSKVVRKHYTSKAKFTPTDNEQRASHPVSLPAHPLAYP